MPVKPIPEGYHTITPYIIAKDAGGLMNFLEKALNAEELYRMENNGKINEDR